MYFIWHTFIHSTPIRNVVRHVHLRSMWFEFFKKSLMCLKKYISFFLVIIIKQWFKNYWFFKLKMYLYVHWNMQRIKNRKVKTQKKEIKHNLYIRTKLLQNTWLILCACVCNIFRIFLKLNRIKDISITKWIWVTWDMVWNISNSTPSISVKRFSSCVFDKNSQTVFFFFVSLTRVSQVLYRNAQI